MAELSDRVFGYVASAAPNEARLAAIAADVATQERPVRVCIIVANERAIQCWRDALKLAAESARAAGNRELAATFRESWDHVELAMATAPRALGITGPVM